MPSFDFHQAKKFATRLDSEEAFQLFKWLKLALDQRHVCVECGNVYGTVRCKLHHMKGEATK